MKFKMNKLSLGLAAAVLCGAAGATDSGSATMDVTAAITDECSVGQTVALAFGNLSVLSNGSQSSTASESTGGGTFKAICTNGTSLPKLKFTSANAGATTSFRLVGADGLTHIVYTLAESGGTAIAYNTAAAFTGFEADGTEDSLAIKGSIAASEKNAKLKQAYTDTITITSTYGV